MKIPRKLYIGGWVIPVKYGKNLKVDGEDCFGYYNEEEKAIYLTVGMSPSRRREIFLHEFTHLIADIYRIKISYNLLVKKFDDVMG